MFPLMGQDRQVIDILRTIFSKRPPVSRGRDYLGPVKLGKLKKDRYAREQ
jgi:hypothetical protein